MIAAIRRWIRFSPMARRMAIGLLALMLAWSLLWAFDWRPSWITGAWWPFGPRPSVVGYGIEAANAHGYHYDEVEEVHKGVVAARLTAVANAALTIFTVWMLIVMRDTLEETRRNVTLFHEAERGKLEYSGGDVLERLNVWFSFFNQGRGRIVITGFEHNCTASDRWPDPMPYEFHQGIYVPLGGNEVFGRDGIGAAFRNPVAIVGEGPQVYQQYIFRYRTMSGVRFMRFSCHHDIGGAGFAWNSDARYSGEQDGHE